MTDRTRGLKNKEKIKEDSWFLFEPEWECPFYFIEISYKIGGGGWYWDE